MRKQDDIRRALPNLVKMYILADTEHVRQAAYQAIITIGMDRAPRAVVNEALAALMEARSVKVKLVSVMLLAQVGPPAKSAVPALLRLSRTNPVWQDQVVYALGQIGCAPGVVPELLRVQQTEESASISAAAEADIALGRLQVPQAIPIMHQHLASRHQLLRTAAAKALGLLGPVGSADTRRRLVQACNDDNAMVREEAVRAIGRVGHTSKVVADALLDRLSDDDTGVRKAAIGAVRNLHLNRRALVEKLIKLINDSDIWVALAAKEAMEAEGWRSVDILRELFHDGNHETRLTAARILAKTSPEGAQVLCRAVKTDEKGAYAALVAMRSAPAYASMFEEALVNALFARRFALAALDTVEGLALTSQQVRRAVADLSRANNELDSSVTARAREVLSAIRSEHNVNIQQKPDRSGDPTSE
ncbi:MAG: hypothetical protein GVY16_09355 [Planctomycetes bacterium]|jgi:HEAT repeat protein|nr:hypothetical protein [Planctomycetota bacterium]